MAIFQASQTRGPRARLRMAVLGCVGALPPGAVLTSPLTASASSKTITVEPGTGHSIQTAVDKAHPGDTIKLEEGTYWQQVNITKDDITIQGAGAGETVIKPPTSLSGNCDAGAGPTGICVGVPPIIEGGPANTVVEGVTVKDLTVTGFGVAGSGGNGMIFFGTDQGKVEDVHATNNGGYGIFFNVSPHGTIRNTLVSGNSEAGVYYGDSPNANALIVDNTARNNGNGIFVRDATQGKVLDNNSQGNCVGILVLNTGSGNDHWLVQGNDVDKNNKLCPGGGPAPPTAGLGIVIASASFLTVREHSVEGNTASANPIET